MAKALRRQGPQRRVTTGGGWVVQRVTAQYTDGSGTIRVSNLKTVYATEAAAWDAANVLRETKGSDKTSYRPAPLNEFSYDEPVGFERNPLLMTMGNPRKSATAASDPREIRRVYGGVTYWIRRAGGSVRDPLYFVTHDGVPIQNPTTYEHALETLNVVTDMVGANPGRGKLMGTDVLAVVYRHKQDGKLYCHGFGDADITLRTHGESLTITALKEWTGVKMYALDDGSIHITKPGARIWEDL